MRKLSRILILLFLTISAINCSYASTQTAIFAGGCFWCMQPPFDKTPGVISTTVGYDGGTRPHPNYKQVSSGATNYAEVIRVTYDANKVSYPQLLQIFWHNIDPTVANRQFCDHGPQYRSAIFYLNEAQRTAALQSLAMVKKQFSTVYTQITPSTHFYPAETYHQKYYQKNPIRYKIYKWNCGREQRLDQVWGKQRKKP